MPSHQEETDHVQSIDASSIRLPRRAMMLASLAFVLTGCSSSQRSSRLPGPAWDLSSSDDAPVYVPPQDSTVASSAGMTGVRPRSEWAAGAPVPSLMNRMTSIRRITVHHDGMSPFTSNDPRSGAARVEAIRRAHRGRGWGDIGYHYAIDRSGTVWEGRPIGWQGAHVKDHNEGNIGIVCLGNFEQQTPTDAQLTALRTHVRRLMSHYRVSAANLKTHRELGPTICPGRHLQGYMVSSRNNRLFG